MKIFYLQSRGHQRRPGPKVTDLRLCHGDFRYDGSTVVAFCINGGDGSMDLDLSSSKNPVGHIPSWAGQGWVSPVSLAASARWVPLPGGDG